ncbi:MAG: hypothetical protein R2843_06545 [Thermomicrobiales bacterium]
MIASSPVAFAVFWRVEPPADDLQVVGEFVGDRRPDQGHFAEGVGPVLAARKVPSAKDRNRDVAGRTFNSVISTVLAGTLRHSAWPFVSVVRGS